MKTLSTMFLVALAVTSYSSEVFAFDAQARPGRGGDHRGPGRGGDDNWGRPGRGGDDNWGRPGRPGRPGRGGDDNWGRPGRPGRPGPIFPAPRPIPRPAPRPVPIPRPAPIVSDLCYGTFVGSYANGRQVVITVNRQWGDQISVHTNFGRGEVYSAQGQCSQWGNQAQFFFTVHGYGIVHRGTVTQQWDGRAYMQGAQDGGFGFQAVRH